METLFTYPQTNNVTPQFRLSFQPFVAFLKAQQQNRPYSDGMNQLYTYLIDTFTSANALIEKQNKPIDKKQIDALFQLATIAVLPLDHTKRDILYAFGLPVPFTLFHYSSAFEQFFTQSPDFLIDLPQQIKPEDKKRFLYKLILEKCYDVPMAFKTCFSFQFQRKQDGLIKYYQLAINGSFINPHCEQELPSLQPAWIDFVNGSAPLPHDVEPLPLDAFTFEGFSFFQMEDVTEAETIQQLQDVFVHLHSDTEPIIYHRFESALRNLCGQPDLQIGIIPMPQVNGNFVYHPDSKTRSVFLRHAGSPSDSYKNVATQQMITHLFEDPSPHIFPGLDGLPESKRQLFYRQGIHSLLVYPVSTAGEVLGILEMSSPRPDAFSDDVLANIERIIPLVQELLRYQLNQFNNNLEQLIRKQFTSLQPSVEWKFYEAAWEYLSRGQKESAGNEPIPIRFPQVYPLYGAVDIRNSSVERHKAVQQDLADQLAAVEQLFCNADFPSSWARPEQLREESYQCQHKLIAGLLPDDEQDVSIFLTDEVNKYLRYLLVHQPTLETAIQQYFAQTDPSTGLFNQALKRYERSIDWLNTAVNEYIDEEEKKLQTIYPHYFERYRTDGTEYTIYVGQSIAPGKAFEPEVGQRLFQWQLTSMVEMAHLTHRLLPHLPLPLQTTQLILAHAYPVDISFRQDERRFDVEGSYSIRYEVLKKRIDKARIDGTQERLTQPGSIALVYTHLSEVADYLPFIKKMQEDGQLQPTLEYLDLEPMQGVAHLKALRVGITYPDSTLA